MKKRNGNGQGSIYKVIRKVKRKEFDKTICKICNDCINKCNREAFERCDKCINCKIECLKHCDRYYCYDGFDAQITINGKQTTVASSKKQKETTNKKMEIESQIQTHAYVSKNGITLVQKINKIIENKMKANFIGENTYRKNKEDLKHIEFSNIADIPMQELTSEQIQDFINSKTYLSQSVISSILQLIKMAYTRAIKDKEIYAADNPMDLVEEPYSEIEVKKIEAFSIEEEQKLLDFIQTSKRLITNNQCQYDAITIKNIIILGLFTGLRVGEMGAIIYDKHIDFEKQIILIESTLTKDINSTSKIKQSTKTGRSKKKSQKKDFREIPFGELSQNDFLKNILLEQIEYASHLKKNKENLLFCRLDGKYIEHTQITALFKKICRSIQIKNDIPTGCHIHMTRHTFATRCIESGMDLLFLAKLLGHSSTRQIEKTYGHILQRYRTQNLDKLKKYYLNSGLSYEKASGEQ